MILGGFYRHLLEIAQKESDLSSQKAEPPPIIFHWNSFRSANSIQMRLILYDQDWPDQKSHSYTHVLRKIKGEIGFS